MTKFITGKIEAGVATLVSDDMQIVEFPSGLLPQGVKTGSVVQIGVTRNIEDEEAEIRAFKKFQQQIYEKYGKAPSAPVLSIKSVTQTSIEIEWKFNLESCNLLGIDCYLNNKLVPSPLKKSPNSLKIGGLQMESIFQVYIVIRTSGGIYRSQTLEQKTLAITDLCGLVIGFGDDSECVDEMKEICDRVGARYTSSFDIDNTHLITESTDGKNYEIASKLNIPSITPEWLRKCQEEHQMVPVRDYYVQ